MKWAETKGRKPRTGDKPLRLRFRNGVESRWTYKAAQIRWTDTGSDWDATEVRIER